MKSSRLCSLGLAILPHSYPCHTVEMGAHTQAVGGGARQFGSCGQVSISQSLFFEARDNLAGRVPANSTAANGAGIWVILSHRGQQQRDVVAL